TGRAATATAPAAAIRWARRSSPLPVAAQAADVVGIGGRAAGEACGARDQHVGAGGGGERRGLRRDAAVDLEIDHPVAAGGGANLVDHAAQRGDLVELAGDEFLPAETRIDRH